MTQPPRPPVTLEEWTVAATEWQNATLLEIQSTLEVLMTQSADLSAAMAQLKTDLTTVSDGIAFEIQQLRDAVGSGADLRAAVDAAIAGLSDSHAQLSSMSTSLAADNPAVPPPAP
jgi:ABC-type transporter Mla subunit MlaD